MYKTFHTRNEKRIIRKKGGVALTKYGYDGVINGVPVEVRECRDGDRFRIQKNVHRELVRNDGDYIFVNHGRTKTVPAKEVSEMIGRGKWFKDRNYPHKFVKKKQVFR